MAKKVDSMVKKGGFYRRNKAGKMLRIRDERPDKKAPKAKPKAKAPDPYDAIRATADARVGVAYAPKVASFNREFRAEQGQKAVIDRAYDAFRADLERIEGIRAQAQKQAQDAQAIIAQGAQNQLGQVAAAQQPGAAQMAAITGAAAPVSATPFQDQIRAALTQESGNAGKDLIAGGVLGGNRMAEMSATASLDRSHQQRQHGLRMQQKREERTALAGEISQARAEAYADELQQQFQNELASETLRTKQQQEAWERRKWEREFRAERTDAIRDYNLDLADDERADAALEETKSDNRADREVTRRGQDMSAGGRGGKKTLTDAQGRPMSAGQDADWRKKNIKIARLKRTYKAKVQGGKEGPRYVDKGKGTIDFKALEKSLTDRGEVLSGPERILLRELTTREGKPLSTQAKRAAREIFPGGRIPKWLK